MSDPVLLVLTDRLVTEQYGAATKKSRTQEDGPAWSSQDRAYIAFPNIG